MEVCYDFCDRITTISVPTANSNESPFSVKLVRHFLHSGNTETLPEKVVSGNYRQENGNWLVYLTFETDTKKEDMANSVENWLRPISDKFPSCQLY
jgi:hypothetical protein